MVEIKNISKSFGDVRALKGLTLSINKNELFGFIGPDGGGKTTLFRILTTLLLPDSGSASMGGLDVVKSFKEIRKRVGYMPGKFSLYQDLTVEENLSFFATVFGTTIKENYYLIKDIYSQIEPFKKRAAGKLSGGMKQKLALSCALIHRPEVLILDEPTTGVDAVSRVEFWNMLKKLKKYGITIVVSTPYMDEALQCDRVALIQDGTIMTVDDPRKIGENTSQKLYSVKGDGSKYILIKSLRDNEFVSTAYAFGNSVHVTFKDNYKPDINFLNKIQNEISHSIDVEEIPPSIEDYVILFDKLRVV